MSRFVFSNFNVYFVQSWGEREKREREKREKRLRKRKWCCCSFCSFPLTSLTKQGLWFLSLFAWWAKTSSLYSSSHLIFFCFLSFNKWNIRRLEFGKINERNYFTKGERNIRKWTWFAKYYCSSGNKRSRRRNEDFQCLFQSEKE